MISMPNADGTTTHILTITATTNDKTGKLLDAHLDDENLITDGATSASFFSRILGAATSNTIIAGMNAAANRNRRRPGKDQ